MASTVTAADDRRARAGHGPGLLAQADKAAVVASAPARDKQCQRGAWVMHLLRLIIKISR
ncbi:hypothetical protein CSZ94_04425 [Janthinobacterium sp. ROICE36]|nr:hypothetical protein CSZ94_04425 [Janthinobacterium sp. ROICE36]